MSQIKIALLIAPGFEEIEALTPFDIFKRAGFDVKLISLAETIEVQSDRGLKILCDLESNSISEYNPSELYIPGGKGGVEFLRTSEKAAQIIIEHHKQNKRILAICASPLCLMDLNLYKNCKLTSHFSAKSALVKAGYKFSEEKVVKEERLWTSQGAGTTADFAFEIVEDLIDKSFAENLREIMVFK